MIELSTEQKLAVSSWIENGDGLSEIQKRLKEDYGLGLTYLDTRLLMDDLKLQPRDPEIIEPAETPESPSAEPPPTPPTDPLAAAAAGGKVSVSMDALARPGTVISGKVTFSDGNKAEWYLDQMGRLGLNPETPGYRPAEKDVLAFQTELQRLAQSSGL